MKTPLLVLLASASSAVLASLIPVSIRQPGLAPSATGDGASGAGEFAGGNRFVVFLSAAGNLVTNDANGRVLDLFRRDLVEGRTDLLSLTASGTAGAGRVEDFSVSADGRRIAFTWAADDASAGDTNGLTDIYVRDLDAGTTRLVSARMDGTGAGNGWSDSAMISGNGRFVVFESTATDLVDGEDVNGGRDVFRRDLESGTTIRISRVPDDAPPDPTPTRSASRNPVVNHDGSIVAFISDSTVLAPLEGYGTPILWWISGASGLKRVRLPGVPSTPVRVTVEEVTMSADGRFLAFAVPGGNPAPAQTTGIWRCEVASEVATQLSEDRTVSVESLASGPSMASDGMTVAFSVEPSPGSEDAVRVLIWKSESGLHTLEDLRQTVPPLGGEPSQSTMPVLSPDGTRLLFVSDAAIPEAGVTAAGTAGLFHRVLATGSTRLISDDTDSVSPAFSPDGSQVVTEEQIPAVQPGDDNGELDVVVTTVADGSRQLVSLAQAEAGQPMASGSSIGGGISDDGRFVGFTSQADDVVSRDSNRSADAFHFDRLGVTNRLMSVGADESAGGGLTAMALASGGHRAALVQFGAGLTAGDTNSSADVYVWDLDTGGVELASAQDGSQESLAAAASDPVISGDGQWVGFRADVIGVPSNFGRLYLRDLQNRRTWWLNDPARVERASPYGARLQLSADGSSVLFSEWANSWYLLRREDGGFQTTAKFVADEAWLSADGGRVVIRRKSTDPVPALVSRSVADGSEKVLLDSPKHGVRDLRASSDGRVITYVRRTNPLDRPPGNPWQVWALSVAGGTEELVSTAPSGAPGSDDSREPQISADGRFIVFRSAAANLVAEDRNGAQDIFVHDRYTGMTTLLSQGENGRPGNSNATRPGISGDGRFATFTTFADHLLPGDHNGLGDVALTEIPHESAPDTDGDGLPDGWERDQFGTLLQNGLGDPDGDGWSNADEFVARTGPTDAASQLRVQASGGIVLEWVGHAGATYMVERREELGDTGAWTATGEELSGHSGTMRALLDGAARGGFFRVSVQ